MASDWYEEMEKAEQEYDAREYELAQEYSRGYEQGRADKYQEIVSEYMLLTEEQVAEIRADAIDEMARVLKKQIYKGLKYDGERIGYFTSQDIDKIVEQLKEQK